MVKVRVIIIAAFVFAISGIIITAKEPNFSLLNGGKSQYNLTHPLDLVGYNKDEAKKITAEDMKPDPTPAEAVVLALADSGSISAADRPFQRYVWVPTGERKIDGWINMTLNVAWSRATPLIKAKSIAQGRLLRVDLRVLAPRGNIESNDFRTIFKLWESLANEPYFHIVRTVADSLPTNATAIRSIDGDAPGSLRFLLNGEVWYKSLEGKTWRWSDDKWQEKNISFPKSTTVAAPGAHVGIDQHVMLQGLTQSNVPIVRYDWWMTKSLQTLNGGIYYDLVGIDRNPPNTTAQKAFFAKFGVDEATIAKLRSDQRVAMFKSRVTGRPRRVDFFRSQGVRPDAGTGLATITFDIGEADTGAESDPIRNLLNFKDKAREVIVERPNGLHAFALFNNAEALQDSAPDDVVKDHTIPAPYPSRLQPAIGCIRCHGPFDGWQPVTNEVKLMLSGYLDVYDDLSDKKGVIPDILDRLAGLYSGDLVKPLRRARDDYSDAVYLVTNGQSVPQASGGIGGVFLEYLYTDVDAQIACKELGYAVPADKAVYYLNIIIPPLAKDVIGIAPEDPILGALKVGLKIQRYQWENVYADAAFRAMQSAKARKEKK